MKVAGVYAITNRHSGSQYVGSAVDIRRRWKSHRSALRNRRKAPPKLQRAWDKHGESAFEFSILLVCREEDTLLYEQIVIDTVAPKYNTRQIAHSNLGMRWSAETNAKKGRSNRTYTVRGVTGSISALAKRFGAVTKEGAAARLARGWDPERAFTEPGMDHRSRGAVSAAARAASGIRQKGADLEFRGVRGSLAQLVEQFGVVSYYAARMRRQRGWPLERVLLEPKTVR